MTRPRSLLAAALLDSPVTRYPDLLAAAIADPDSDAPRRALAQALRSDGDAFASVIDQQLDWATLAPWDRDRHRAELEASDAILRHHPALHLAVAGEAGRAGLMGMERGLIEHARVGIDELIDDANVFFGATALRGVELFPVDDQGLAALAALPQASALRRIRISGPAVGDPGVEALLSSPILASLRSLSLYDVGLSTATVQRLASSATFALEELVLPTETRFSPAAFAALSNGSRSTALRTLVLEGHQVDAAAQRILAAGRFPRLRELWLIGNQLDHGLAALANTPLVAGLEALVLGSACSDVGALAAFLGSLTRLQRLHIERCADGARVIEALRPSAATLHDISFYGVHLGEAGARALCELGLGNVGHLQLAMSDIGDSGARALAASSWAPRLTRLSLNEAGLGPDGVGALAGVMPELVELDLSGNRIGDEGAYALAASSALGNLERLLLINSGIGPAGARALLDAPGLARAHTIVLPRLGRAVREETMARRRDVDVVEPRVHG